MMSQKQKTLRTISIIELVVGLVYFVEGIIVTSGKPSYFIAGAFTVITALFCYLAVKDPSKAKMATILLWVTIILNLIAAVIAFIGKAGAASIGTMVVDICIAAILIKLIKEIHG